MTTQEKEICENCSGGFVPRFPNQKTCYSCWREAHPNNAEKYKQCLFGALGQKYYPNSKAKYENRVIGISDDELLEDKNYIGNATQSPGTSLGREPESEASEGASKLAVGQHRSDGLVGKQPLRKKSVFIGKFPLKNGKINQKTMPSKGNASKIVCKTKPSLIQIVSPTGEVKFIEPEKVKAILTDSPLWFE